MTELLANTADNLLYASKIMCLGNLANNHKDAQMRLSLHRTDGSASQKRQHTNRRRRRDFKKTCTYCEKRPTVESAKAAKVFASDICRCFEMLCAANLSTSQQ